MKLQVAEGSQEWSALYVDGKLDRVGNHYLIDERIRQLCGVETIQTDAFLQGGNQTSDCVESWDEVLEAIEQEKINQIKAKELRRQAEALLAEAEELDK